MNSVFEAEIQAARDLIFKKRYQEALSLLDHTQREASVAPDDDDILRLEFMRAQCQYRTGLYQSALETLEQLSPRARSLADHALFASIKLYFGRVYQQLGRASDAREAYVESYVFFKRVDDHRSAAMVLINLAGLHFLGGNLHQSFDVLEEALQFCKDHSLLTQVRTCEFNLCRVSFLLGDLGRIQAVLDGIDSEDLGAADKAYVNLFRGMLELYRLNYQRAHELLLDSQRYFLDVGQSRDNAVCLEYLGLNEYFHGNLSKAKEYYKQVFAMPEPTASAMAQTLRMLTDVYIAEGDFSKAMETAVKAEAAITKTKELVELGALHRALALLSDKRDDAQLASEHFGKSVEILTRHGARYELAVTYLAAGEAGCLDAETKKERLHQAKTLFTELDVPKRVAQVEKAVAKVAISKLGHRKRRSEEFRETVPLIVTKNNKMLKLLELAYRLRNGEQNVMITGETGTGKELLARHMHDISPRRDKPFRIVNCANLPETLVESLLFGCRKGVHSGATADQTGMIEEADGGTFCFDEIGEIPPIIQAKLLRVVDKKRILPLGEKRERSIDIRFLALTNRNIDDMIRDGSFRVDLWHRFSKVHHHLPPLRERPEDLVPLVEQFLADEGLAPKSIDGNDLAELLGELHGYHWPGNVREIENLVSLAAALSPPKDFHGFLAALGTLIAEQPGLSRKDRMLAALKRNNDNQTRAARDLGVPLSTFRDWLQKHGISK